MRGRRLDGRLATMPCKSSLKTESFGALLKPDSGSIPDCSKQKGGAVFRAHRSHPKPRVQHT